MTAHITGTDHSEHSLEYESCNSTMIEASNILNEGMLLLVFRLRGSARSFFELPSLVNTFTEEEEKLDTDDSEVCLVILYISFLILFFSQETIGYFWTS